MSKLAKRQAVISDEQIVELYWQREESAIEETDRRYGRILFGIAYNILHDRSDSEECRNDVYLDVWNAIPPTRPAAFSAFITQIMRRIAIDRYRAKSSRKRIPSEMTVSMEDLENSLHSENSVEAEYIAEEVGKVINDYVKTLTERRRYIFIDRFYLAETVDSIASDLSVSVHTVYREIDRVKAGLKLHLERNGIFV